MLPSVTPPPDNDTAAATVMSATASDSDLAVSSSIDRLWELSVDGFTTRFP